jgi:hypothetical protein
VHFVVAAFNAAFGSPQATLPEFAGLFPQAVMCANLLHVSFMSSAWLSNAGACMTRTVQLVIANTTNSELLDFVLAAEMHQGLFVDRDCWAKELLDDLMFADLSKDWHTHMMQLKSIAIPRGLAGLAKQKFAECFRGFDNDPTDPECPHRQRSTYCHLMRHADDSGLPVAPEYISADMPLAQKQATARVRLAAAPSSAIPSMVSHTHSAPASCVDQE